MDKKGQALAGVPLWIILVTLVTFIFIVVSLLLNEKISGGGLFS